MLKGRPFKLKGKRIPVLEDSQNLIWQDAGKHEPTFMFAGLWKDGLIILLSEILPKLLYIKEKNLWWYQELVPWPVKML